MKKSIYALFLWCLSLLPTMAEPVVIDGVYSISCQEKSGFVGLGAYHNMSPYICYVTNESELSKDAYWRVTLTNKGYTFQNEASGEWLVYTTGRVDQYYKYMTLVSELPQDGSLYWNIQQQSDGSLCVQSALDNAYYWNLRVGQGLLGTYAGSERDVNERFYFTQKKSDEPQEPEPQPIEITSFPKALHVYLADGGIKAFPLTIITSHKEEGGRLNIQTSVGQTFSFALANVINVSEEAPTDFPMFESFKFNNKFNDQLFEDVYGEIDGDVVTLTVTAIGKRLTPSFKVPDDQTLVYVNDELQDSKVTRLRFDKDIYYVVTRPGITMLLPDDVNETSYSMHPYGRMVRVHVNWLTDRAEVPRIDINTIDGSSEISRDEFKDAVISIDGHDIFPSMEATAVQIKGRGNSSWGWPKKPYRLKFEKKEKPLGMKKGKNWVLLSNYQTGSLITNAIGMKAANLMEASAANHIVPVDVYINGEYRGSYNFTEKVGLSNNSVELRDESAAALLEFDSYYDEPDGQKFRSWPYDLPINVKEPDFSEGTSHITLETVENDFNQFATTLFNGEDISPHVDVEQLARFLMVNELICNFELYHPKSTFCYRESFESDTSKYVFGPVWDLDWAFGYEGHYRYFQDNATSDYWEDMPFNEVKGFIQDLRYKYAPLSTLYHQLWEKFMQEDLTELIEYCQDYYDFAHVSFENNTNVWGDFTDYQELSRMAANWLETRANRIYNDILENSKERVNVTYDYVYNGQVVHSETIQVPEGSKPVSPLADNWFIYAEPISSLPETIDKDSRFSYEITWNGPFEFTNSLTNAHWYNMTIRSKYYVSTSETEPYYPTEWTDEENLLHPEYQWAFGGDPFHIKVYNRATGLNRVLTLDGSEDDNQVNAVMRTGDYSWEIRPNSDGFVLSPHNNPKACINQYGGEGGALQTWNDRESPSDDGSTFRIYDVLGVILPGDVNSDGVVDISDYIGVANHILGNTPESFNLQTADVNNDGVIDISDYIGVANIILTGTSTGK